MATVDKIRRELIDKIRTIQKKDVLVALDKLIASRAADDEIVALNADQKEMLEMSEADIKSGRLISQEAMHKRNLEWLNEL